MSDQPASSDQVQRVSKTMAQRGLCSRRVAERLIAAGFVVVNGHSQREQGWKAPANAEISIDPRGQAWLDQAVTVVLHKPEGVVSTQPEGAQVPAWKLLLRANAEGAVPAEVMERITAQPWYFSVTGRLDKDSRGLLIMTQDGVLAKNITGSRRFTKEYEVQLSEAVQSGQIEQLRSLRRLEDKPLLPMVVTRMGDKALRFQLVEGRKHQIRLACQKVGLHVTDLLRTRIGPVKIGRLARGHWRLATDAELAELKTAGSGGANKSGKAKGQAKRQQGGGSAAQSEAGHNRRRGPSGSSRRRR